MYKLNKKTGRFEKVDVPKAPAGASERDKKIGELETTIAERDKKIGELQTQIDALKTPGGKPE